jgi:hypothetical protein
MQTTVLVCGWRGPSEGCLEDLAGIEKSPALTLPGPRNFMVMPVPHYYQDMARTGTPCDAMSRRPYLSRDVVLSRQLVKTGKDVNTNLSSAFTTLTKTALQIIQAGLRVEIPFRLSPTSRPVVLGSTARRVVTEQGD